MAYNGAVTPDFILNLIIGLLTVTCNVLVVYQNERAARRGGYVSQAQLEVLLDPRERSADVFLAYQATRRGWWLLRTLCSLQPHQLGTLFGSTRGRVWGLGIWLSLLGISEGNWTF